MLISKLKCFKEILHSFLNAEHNVIIYIDAYIEPVVYNNIIVYFLAAVVALVCIGKIHKNTAVVSISLKGIHITFTFIFFLNHRNDRRDDF